MPTSLIHRRSLLRCSCLTDRCLVLLLVCLLLLLRRC